jgi:tetratricopeptide (TPR) repeat protein
MLEAAISDYAQAIELNPCHCRAYYNRAFCHDRLGHNQEAILDYTRALELEPGNATAYHNRGSLYERVGRWDMWIKGGGHKLEGNKEAHKSWSPAPCSYCGHSRRCLALVYVYACATHLHPQRRMCKSAEKQAHPAAHLQSLAHHRQTF